MGIEETIRSLGSVVWPGKPGPDSAKPRSAEGRPRAVNPTTAQTPKEALTYIERLHKTGRMEDLATLLRRSPVFREAWLTLQQSRPEGLEASGGHQPASPSRAETSSLGNFSLPSPATRPPVEPGPKPGGAEASRFFGVHPENSGGRHKPHCPELSCSLCQAHPPFHRSPPDLRNPAALFRPRKTPAAPDQRQGLTLLHPS